MSTWGPWYFLDDEASIQVPADRLKNSGLQDRFRMEANADFDVYLFARRQDQDDFAYFYVTRSGDVEDSVVQAHLSFSGGPDHYTPVRAVAHQHRMNLQEWLRDTTVPDMMDWFAHDEEDPD